MLKRNKETTACNNLAVNTLVSRGHSTVRLKALLRTTGLRIQNPRGAQGGRGNSFHSWSIKRLLEIMTLLQNSVFILFGL